MLIVVNAEDVRDGEPRRWFADEAAARRGKAIWSDGDVLHLEPNHHRMGAALVDRASPVGIESGIAMEMKGVPRTLAGDLHALVELLKERGPAPEEAVATEEKVWRQAFNAALVNHDTLDSDACKAEVAGRIADAALVEWKKRWQR